MFEVLSDVPLPYDNLGSRGGRPRKYPFNEMRPGDSFFIPIGEGQSITKIAYRTHNAVQSYRKRHKEVKFTVQRLEDRVGVWRVA